MSLFYNCLSVFVSQQCFEITYSATLRAHFVHHIVWAIKIFLKLSKRLQILYVRSPKHHRTARLSHTLCFPSFRHVFASGLCSSQLVTSVWTSRTGAAVWPVCSTHERLLLGNLKTLGDWGCLAAWRVGRVKWRGGEFEVKGLHSSEAKQLLLSVLTVSTFWAIALWISSFLEKTFVIWDSGIYE